MKTITAYIKPNKLSDVTLALHQIEGVSGASVSDVHGFGRGRAKDAPDSVALDVLDYLPAIRIEIACSDDLVEKVVSTIETVAHTGLRGDGKIYVASIEQAVRISTGERGDTAI
jgi:nitrogen regulatory protein PII